MTLFTDSDAMSQMYSHQQSQLVWDLLLSEVEPLDQHVVCKLLCCSKSMCDLVHSKCAGQYSKHRIGFYGADWTCYCNSRT